ncbi:heterogeneous nuclear ribonucleoprotein L-like [Actinia tenebrosa]|uniref:Heterogeneous nuclear ribonucleoprotein L-like n=1 Tax=Actinia tenebrosa TaxID=6105 RepID=A0A6P8IQT7_ACTTE|nr:heterogeneous nuclear ribonucleoprotein L-like [Actinia tenebrosa]
MAEKHGFEEMKGFQGNEYEDNPYKRARVDASGYGNAGERSPGFQGGQDRHYAEPSRVVHIRGVADEAREQDILQCLSPFGKIACITMMPKIRQALVEFEDIECSSELVQQAQAGNPVLLCGRAAYANFSKSQQISRNVHANQNSPPNKILLVTIINPQYPVTTDILYTIFSKQGAVQRIVIFRKSGLQAMVEYDTVETAQAAKDALNGADIYTGCNTLKIENARAQHLNVYKNDSETYDYTQDKGPGLGTKRKQGLLSPPPGPPMYGGHGHGHGMPPGPAVQQPSMYRPPPSSGCVIMVYGLDKDRMNCDRLFNLLCCYGNILKIKFLLGKPGTAMVELNDHVACETAIENLSGLHLFGSKVDFGFSKQSFLVEPTNIPNLPDGTPSYKNYVHCKNHRFTSAAASSKNRIFSPTKVLHFFNAPLDYDKEKLEQMCIESGSKTPSFIKIFTPPGNARSVSGLIEWATVEQAMEAMAACNHFVVKNPSAKTIFTVKLAFSSTPSAS